MPPPFVIAKVSGLPWPHYRFKCENADAFRGAHDHAAVLARLAPETLERCWTHTVDWRRVAAVAVDAVSAGHDFPSEDAFRALGRSLGEHLYWLFAEPIFVSGDRLGNGQHRVCAMKAQGVPLVPVENPAYEPDLT
jgi:hypothetical protein